MEKGKKRRKSWNERWIIPAWYQNLLIQYVFDFRVLTIRVPAKQVLKRATEKYQASSYVLVTSTGLIRIFYILFFFHFHIHVNGLASVLKLHDRFRQNDNFEK